MHNWVMQVLWLEKGAAGEDTAGAGAVRWRGKRAAPGGWWGGILSPCMGIV
jgi:hypothetical protein